MHTYIHVRMQANFTQLRRKSVDIHAALRACGCHEVLIGRRGRLNPAASVSTVADEAGEHWAQPQTNQIQHEQ